MGRGSSAISRLFVGARTWVQHLAPVKAEVDSVKGARLYADELAEI